MKQQGWRSGNRLAWNIAAIALCVCASQGGVSASGGRIATLEERFSGAEHVVVATARGKSSAWHQNEQGDRIIVTRVLLEVDESIKGGKSEQLWLEIEGGTVDGITLEVSSAPVVHDGERAVFFLNRAEKSVHRPYLKGQGVLALDQDEMVRGSSLHLNQIRGLARVRQ